MLLFVLVAVAVIVTVRWIAERTALPAAALLTLAGLGYVLLPGPNLPLDPHVVLTFVLPPLLYSAALDASLVAIRRNLRIVVSLSVTLVLLTAVGIGVGMWLLVPGATLAVGIAVGAAVAPPDPVAALAVGRRAGLPDRLITLIQGEGLLNDATALTILAVAVTAARGDGFSAPGAVGQFLLAAVGGVLTGVAVAFAIRPLRRLRRDPLISNAVSLATPFVAYLLGEWVHVSGVLAVVVAGLIIGHQSPSWVSGASRLQTDAVWRLVDFLLEGFVFLLIGQQLPAVVQGLGAYPAGTIVTAALVTVGGMLLIRPLWLLLSESLPASLHTRLATGRLSGPELTVLSWAGTRGVISLVAIFTLPTVTDNGAPFPLRDLLLFCTFVAVLVTLVAQGFTFGPLVRLLGVRADQADSARVRNEARIAALDAAVTRLAELRTEQHDDLEDHAIEAIETQFRDRRNRYQRRALLLGSAEDGDIPFSPQYEAALRVRRAVLDAQRDELLRWRDIGRLPDTGLRALQRELDHEEGLLPTRDPT
jgi:CPA1 family monovalent cation:H+ antiporter